MRMFNTIYVFRNISTIKSILLFIACITISISLSAQLDLDFDTDRGYYTNSFNLTLSINDPAATIRYTTNGTKPTPNSGTIYTGPIAISTTSFVRAIAYASYDTTKVLTHTFIFPEDVIDQPNSKSGFPTSGFAFDNSIKNHSTYGPMLEGSLSEAPSLSLVMDLDDFVDVHNSSVAAEYETSVELILPNGEKGYQANGGIERAGGSSYNSAKRNFRLSFKAIYGDSKFDYPLFGDDAAESFDQIALKPGFHGCMHLGLDHRRGGTNDLSDQVMRDLQGEMNDDGVSIDGSFMHLYINGIYWGVYNPQERATNSFAESYYGGDKDDYDSLKGEQLRTAYPTPNMEATDGNTIAWDSLIYIAENLDLSSNSNYQLIQKYVDPVHFADYNLVNNYGPHSDDHRSGKNSFVTRDRTGTEGFKFWIWDTEPALGHYWTWNVQPFGSHPYNPIFLPMLDNDDFKTLVADRLHCHCFEDGALTVANAQNTYDAVFDSAEKTFIAEAARWAELEEYTAFLNKRDTIVNDYLPTRTNFLIDLYKDNDVYPSIDGVVYNQFGGQISQSFPISLSNSNGSGTIYYTTDGTDPRASGGGISSSAQTYSGTFTLATGVYTVQARVRVGSTWSAMCPVTFYVNQQYQDLVINEIHYNPVDLVNPPDTTSGRNFEFIEIKNCGSTDINMRDMYFEKGIRLTIEEDLILQPNGFVVFAEDEFWFQQKYGFVPDATYAGKLDNGGENLWLVDPFENIADSLRYNDNAPWPGTADKGFYSLALQDCSTDNAVATNWSIQSVFSTPRAENFFTDFGEHGFSGIVFNEIHYNPFDEVDPITGDTIDGRKFEFIELKNISNAPIDLSGTIIARGVDYEFENGVSIQPGQFIVLAEDKSSFEDRYGFQAFDKYDGQLSNGGETLWLVNSNGILLDAVEYDDAFPWDINADGGAIDYSLALIDGAVNNNTRLNWKVQCNSIYTPGAENDFGCFTGLNYSGLTINEIHYQPSGGQNREYIEILNNSFQPINLEQVILRSAITYVFDDVFIFPNQFVVIANDSATFQNTYGFAPDGEYVGNLNNSGETIILEDLFGERIDIVDYDNIAPWTTEPTNGIKSLALIDPNLNNNVAQNWCVQDVSTTAKATNTFEDSDSDSIFDCIDSCPNLDNSLIGTACEDGDPCTSGETYKANCNCTGGIFQDTDSDGICDAQDQCIGIDDTLIGTACSDGDPCTVGEVLNANCQCIGGTTGDSDNDGVCDGLDQCPNFNDSLIGQSCNDGDPCTVGETYSTNCLCEGGTLNDADGDGVCNNVDQCPGTDDNLIGQTCNDGNPCTVNDTYNVSCNCIGVQSSDSDNDGFCDAIDPCPNFDNSLIGQPCDDGILCFSGSTWDSNCNCTGGQYVDTDNDNVCDNLDECPGFDDNIDVNNNGIPDGCEGCEDVIVENNQNTISNNKSANIRIESNGTVYNGNISYSAGQEVRLNKHFEVKSGAVFHAFIAPCN